MDLQKLNLSHIIKFNQTINSQLTLFVNLKRSNTMRVKLKYCYCCRHIPDPNFYLYNRDIGIQYSLCASHNEIYNKYDNVLSCSKMDDNYLVLSSSWMDLYQFYRK
jgi:hypothetical protein